MNVGIFTFPNSTSYGAVLQMYALYHTLENMGHAPNVINYKNKYMKRQKHTSRGSWLRRTAERLLHRGLFRKFARFENEWVVKYPKVCCEDPGKLPGIGRRYDAVICGSDQVWNPDVTGRDLSYFLNFCDEHTRRVAYAPSFGISEFPDDFSNEIRSDLEKFHALSVREAPGRTLIAALVGKDSPLVCDPTLLLDSDDWTRLEKKHPAADGAYILYYTVYTSATLWNKCKELARKKGIKIVVVGGNWLQQLQQKDETIRYAVDIGPDEWLYLVHHARYVVTNSFHGTAFSINYRKDFYVEFSSRANSRLEQITRSLGLDGQIVGAEPLSGAAVDYSVADHALPQMREKSVKYLTEALK